MNSSAPNDPAAMWYYEHGNQQAGPVAAADLRRYVAEGRLPAEARVWRHGMAEWTPAVQTELWTPVAASRPLPVPAPPPPLFAPSAAAPTAYVRDDAKRLQSWFTTWWICLAAGLPLSIVIIGFGGIVAAAVFYFMMLHKLWSLIPPAAARTTPGKAVGFLFIPFFNVYWNFVAFHGLAQALNVELRRDGVSGRDVPDGQSLAYCILLCCSIIPYLGILTGLAAFVIGSITLKQMKDAGIALIERRCG